MRRLAWSRSRFFLAALILGGGACGPSDDAPTCDGIVAGSLVISEVQADFDAPNGASGADTGHEWFELYNASSAPVELAGVVLEHMRPSETTGKSHVMAAVSIPAGGYLVLGNVVPETRPPHVDYGYGAALGDLFNSDGGKLRVSCGGTLIDEAIYDSVEAGHTRQLDGKQAPDYLTNDAQTSWCTAAEVATDEYEPANFGTPGAPNQECMNVIPGQCDDNGTPRATVVPVPGDLVITEVMPDPAAVGDAVGEWIEVLVNRDIDLNDLGVAGATGNPVLLSSSSCLRATAGSYLVFARSADMAMNGGLPQVDGTTVTLSNSGGTVRLVMGATELDAFAWPSSRSGKSIQLTAGLTTPADNDVAANLCDGAAPYGAGDLGTPGAANRDCGTVAADMCTDASSGLLRPIVKPTAGQLVINEWMPNPMLVSDSAGEWFELKALADIDLNGLQIGDSALVTTPVVPSSGMCVRLMTGEFVVFAQTIDSATNGMLPPVQAAFPTGVDLVQGSAMSPGTLQIAIDSTVLDTVTWTASTAAKSIMIDSDGTQCNAPVLTDVPAPPVAVPTYNGTDVGTPGAVNTPPECP